MIMFDLQKKVRCLFHCQVKNGFLVAPKKKRRHKGISVIQNQQTSLGSEQHFLQLDNLLLEKKANLRTWAFAFLGFKVTKKMQQ